MCHSKSRTTGAKGSLIMGNTARIAAEGLVHHRKMQMFSIEALSLIEALNLKGSISFQNSEQHTNLPISLTEADINTISAVGNTWLEFVASTTENFSMNIGVANNSSPQTWILPANFKTNFNGAERRDFLAPTTLPLAFRLTGANKVMKSHQIDNWGNGLVRYDHFNVTSTSVIHVGSSCEMEFGTDPDYDEPDFQFSDVPYNLGDTWSATEEFKDYLSDLNLERIVETTNIDAYGTISTPDGTFNCLRMSYITQKYTRPDESSGFTWQSTKNGIGFITKEGYYFYSDVSATNGTANCSNFSYRKVVSTSDLTETSDIKINNDSTNLKFSGIINSK